MGRPKGYTRETVLAAAEDLFWRRGWEATSVKHLEAATGLNKFGLYSEFGNKRGLYLACQEAYVRDQLRPGFDGWPEGLSAEGFLRAVADRLAGTPGYGCFLLQGALESEGNDGDLNRLLAETYGRLEARLARRWSDPRLAAAFAMALRGLMTSGRLGLDRETLHRAVDGLAPLFAGRPGPNPQPLGPPGGEG